MQAALCRQATMSAWVSWKNDGPKYKRNNKNCFNSVWVGIPRRPPEFIPVITPRFKSADKRTHYHHPPKERKNPTHIPIERGFVLLPFLHTPHVQTNTRILCWPGSLLLYITGCFHHLYPIAEIKHSCLLLMAPTVAKNQFLLIPAASRRVI